MSENIACEMKALIIKQSSEDGKEIFVLYLIILPRILQLQQHKTNRTRPYI